jgi:hypothetical protein
MTSRRNSQLGRKNNRIKKKHSMAKRISNADMWNKKQKLEMQGEAYKGLLMVAKRSLTLWIGMQDFKDNALVNRGVKVLENVFTLVMK